MTREMKDIFSEATSKWGSTRIKDKFKIIAGNGFKPSLQGNKTGLYPVFKAGDISNSKKILVLSENYIDEEVCAKEKFSVIPPKSILMPKIGEAMKKNSRSISGTKCCIDNNCQAMVPYNYCYLYAYYLFNIIDMKYFNNGGTIPSINNQSLKTFCIPNPPLSEQQKIADFLDEKVKEIDNAIEKTKETIELYKKYKQAVITQAVTKGLDPNVEMKIINVKGVNKIPKTWSVADFTKVNYIRGRLGWKGLKADEYVDQGYPFLSAFNIINDKLSWNNLNYITKERYDESPEIKLKENDLLLVKDGNGIGKCAFIDSLPLGEATVNSSLAVITPADLVYYKYEYYFFLSTIFQNVIWLLKNGMGVPHLTQESMKNIKMPLPPIKEQIEIALYLDNKCDYIDVVISKEESIILMLENYKKSLIYEYVTGKKEVK